MKPAELIFFLGVLLIFLTLAILMVVVWKRNARAGNRQKRDRLIFGMTSIPERFASEDFDQALQSLLDQRLAGERSEDKGKADFEKLFAVVVVSLPLDREYDQTKVDGLLRMDRVIVSRPPKDHGPITKLIGVLSQESWISGPRFPFSTVRTVLLADDDTQYDLDAAATLLSASSRAVGFAGRTRDTLQYVWFEKENVNQLALLETYAMVAYDAQLFEPCEKAIENLLQIQGSVEEARFTDDITIGEFVLSKGAEPVLVSRHEEYSPIANHLSGHGVELRNENLRGDRNMRVYSALCLRHPLTVHAYPISKKVRLGAGGDGGYVVADFPGGNNRYDAYISAGIADEESFTQDLVHRLFGPLESTKLYAFDGTIERYPSRFCQGRKGGGGRKEEEEEKEAAPFCHRLEFHRKNIGNANDSKTTNLHDILQQHNAVFLKMDIEGGEWPWLESLGNELWNLKQIVIELHGVNDDSYGATHVAKLALLRKLARTHCLVHIHGNNYSGVSPDGVPDVLEATYVNRRLLPKGELPLNTTPFPTSLDAPNMTSEPDYPLTKPPFVDQGLSETQLAELYANLESVHILFSQFKIPYWLTFGSLLGAVRHAAQIPWDDDADICVPHTFEKVMQSEEFKTALVERGLVFDSSGYVPKIYRADHNKADEFPVPWIDVFFVTQNPDDHTWSFHNEKHIHAWPKCHASIPDKAIHPTTPCTFGHLELQCPQDAHYELSRCYGEHYMTVFDKYPVHDKTR